MTAKGKREEFVLVGPDDGYTLSGVCRTEGRPPLKFTYRPALPEAVYAYRQAVRDADSGEQHMAAVVALLGGHVVSWELKRRAANGHPEPLPFAPSALQLPAVRMALGVTYLDQMVNYVTGYTAGEWEQDEKNS